MATVPSAADRSQALQLTAHARELIDQGKYAEAREVLDHALEADPNFADVYINLGYLEELNGTGEGAAAAYGQALTINPLNDYARQRFNSLFYGTHFPRRLKLTHLPLLPVRTVLGEVKIDTSLPPTRHRRKASLAYTTGMLYPEQMHSGGALLSIPLPIAGRESGERCRLNRVCYGLAALPGSTELCMRVAVYYPSPNLSESGKDYSALATRLCHWLVRLEAYYQLHLGLDLPPEPVAVYLCEAGPSGAETYKGALYFYDIDEDRTPLEWIREAAHETGHLLLPQVGRFSAPEPWGNGHVGERLGLQWLAQEAGLVASAPWPDQAAQDRVSGLCGGPAGTLHDYLAQRCRPLLDAWCQAGPKSPLLTQDNEATLSYFLGFVLWVQAAHDDAVLADTLFEASGLNPFDYVKAYQTAVKKRLSGPPGSYLPLYAGALDLTASQLTQTPSEGALRRENIVLSPGDTAVWPLYLPAGSWNVVLVGTAGAQLAIKFDDQPVALQADKHGMFTVTTAQPAWHRLTAEAGGEGAVRVDYVRVEAGREA